MAQKNLQLAKQKKTDEFYTQLVDIEKELKHYKDQFRGKVVYCNCDDPFESNFFRYFAANFNTLGLKKLITTSYVKSPIAGGQLPLFEVKGLKPKGKEPFKIEINEVLDSNSDGAIGLSDVEWLLKHDANVSTPLKGDGDFRSQECIELLKEADIVVTNPPFAKTYKLSAEGDDRHVDTLLKEYRLLSYETAKNELRSNLMFLERYHDLLKPGGRLITVLDDGILSGDKYAWFRRWLLENFIINAVVSLHGDAFQRSKARVKTSLIVLSKKTSISEKQCDVFMYPCCYVGLDDPSRSRSMPVDIENRKKARAEIITVAEKYGSYCDGKRPRGCVVPAAKIIDRLDVKHCLIQRGSSKKDWESNGFNVVKISDIAAEKLFPESDVVECSAYDSLETYLRVTYSGEAQRGELVDPSTTQHSKLYIVRRGDVAISNIAATYGSVGYITDDTDGCVASNEYTILTPRNGIPERVLWFLLRSSVFRSEMLLAATGANRTRVRWDLIKSIEVPLPNPVALNALNNALVEAEIQSKAAQAKRENVIQSTSNAFKLKSSLSETILDAFKPPK